MSAFTSTIIIHSEDLGQEATLLLTFNSQPMPGIYNSYFPTAWQVTTFGATGPYAMSATYKNQLAFVRPQVVDDVIINASTWVDINTEQQTNLTQSPSGVYQFSPPIAEAPPALGTLQAWNRTNLPQAIGIAFDSGSQYPPSSVLLFNGVPAGFNVTAEFTPILTAYIVTNYQQNQIIRGAIQSPQIWSVNLAQFPGVSSWTFSRDPTTGDFAITPDFATKKLSLVSEVELTPEQKASGAHGKHHEVHSKKLTQL